MTDAGFNPRDISVKLIPKKKGIAGDIVDEANSGYDVIVLGRRGVSGIKEFLFGSISQKVLQLAKDVSVLIVN
ncbi:MAG: universal stress protein [Desulfobacterales bacterium]|nr:universal stress protein [Desulfobacterales bacterium]